MTSPSYDHVFVPPPPEIPWTSLKQFETLAQLHTKYWGKPIQGNEFQLQMPKSDDEDQSEVGPGCFDLNLDIEFLETQRLWVRTDYLRLYDYCKFHCDFVEKSQEQGPKLAPSVVITGQPGIGKSCWIFYAVRRRLGESNPFLWYFDSKWYLFVRDGVFQCPGPLEVNSFQRYLWAFADADASPNIVPLGLSGWERRVFSILVTSPQCERWKSLEKNMHCIVLTMNPWSWEEILEAVAIHGLQDRLEDIRHIYDEYGPIPRLCIDSAKFPRLLMAHKERRHEAIIRLSSRYLLEVATQSDKVSHAVFLVRRENVADLQTTIVQPITHSVRQLLKTKLMKEDWKDQSVAYGHLATHPQMRQLAGQVFESMAQLRLQKQVVLDLVPMTRQPASGRSKAKWIMTPRATAASSLTAPNVHDAANTPISIKFTPEGVEVYTGPTPANILPNIFYLPKSLNQPAFDSFILADEVLYIFQFSIASEHEINPSMMDFFPHATLREAPWCFIFIVPPDEMLAFPEPSGDDGEKLKEFWKRAILFTAEFDPSKHTRPELGGQTSVQSPSTPATLLKQTPRSRTKRRAEDASPAQDLARLNGNKRRDLQA